MAEAKGRNSRRYLRNNRRLRDSLEPYCSWCGEWVDTTLPRTDPMSWTTDHTARLVDGGDLYGERTLMHRRCNSQKNALDMQRSLTTTRDW